jgi:hypothetical protein
MDESCERKELRRFGLTLCAVVAFWGGIFLWRKNGYYVYAFVLSGCFLLLGVFFPARLRGVQKAWLAFVLLLSRVIRLIVLNVLFFLIVTPLGLVARLCGVKFLDLKFRDGKKSYWVPRTTVEREKKRYEYQY